MRQIIQILSIIQNNPVRSQDNHDCSSSYCPFSIHFKHQRFPNLHPILLDKRFLATKIQTKEFFIVSDVLVVTSFIRFLLLMAQIYQVRWYDVQFSQSIISFY